MKIKLKDRVTIETNEYKARELSTHRFLVYSRDYIPYIKEMKLQHKQHDYVVVSITQFDKFKFYVETENEINEEN
jgi:hypothetical protein